jgi:DNA-binding transcriptional regulator YdaS (Cro superfamily)
MTLYEYIKAERGNAKSLAESLGVSISYVSQMASGKSPISPERCIPIEIATKGQVTRYELRPDVFGIEQRRKVRRIADKGRREHS